MQENKRCPCQLCWALNALMDQRALSIDKPIATNEYTTKVTEGSA